MKLRIRQLRLSGNRVVASVQGVRLRLGLGMTARSYVAIAACVGLIAEIGRETRCTPGERGVAIGGVVQIVGCFDQTTRLASH